MRVAAVVSSVVVVAGQMQIAGHEARGDTERTGRAIISSAKSRQVPLPSLSVFARL